LHRDIARRRRNTGQGSAGPRTIVTFVRLGILKPLNGVSPE
jgi:hypothetical protein